MAKELLPDAWYQAGVWRRLHQVLLEELAQADRIDWDRAAAVPAPGEGPRNGQEPNGSRQTGHEAPSCGRRPRHLARGPGERRERARFEDDARHRRRHRAHPRQDARQAPSPTAQAPCRQGLRLPSPPSGPAQAPHHPPHRPLWCRAQEPPGTLSWLNRFRRLKIRYEHRADIHLAFLQLGCALISLRFLG